MTLNLRRWMATRSRCLTPSPQKLCPSTIAYSATQKRKPRSENSLGCGSSTTNGDDAMANFSMPWVDADFRRKTQFLTRIQANAYRALSFAGSASLMPVGNCRTMTRRWRGSRNSTSGHGANIGQRCWRFSTAAKPGAGGNSASMTICTGWPKPEPSGRWPGKRASSRG